MDIFLETQKNNLLELKKYLQYNQVNVTCENNKNLLHYAVLGKAIDCINLLIDSEININHRDLNGQTPIFDAAIKANLGIVKMLVRNNCSCNIKDNLGNIPLFYAIKTNNSAVVDLLSRVSDLNIKNDKEEDISLISIKYNYHNLEKFVNVDSYDYKNDTISHYAVKYNNYELVKKYCNRYTVNQKNADNETVFYYAVKYSSRDIIRYLIQFIPVIDICNKYSESLLSNVSNNHYLIDDLIENYISSLDFIYYKQNNKHIYEYLCVNEIGNINKTLLNKKDNFSLSLVDYINFYDDKTNLKKLK